MHSEIYTDNEGSWRWRLVATAGETVACSNDGYANYADCLSGLDQVKAWGASHAGSTPPASALPADPRRVAAMYQEPTAENAALFAMLDQLLNR